MRVAVTLLIVVFALVAVSMLPIRQSENPPFASPAFQRAFSGDLSAATRLVDLWGSDPLVWRVEPYHDDRENHRVVQYFERGRMELQTATAGVSHGLLARELTLGEIDLGDGLSLERQAPEISIDSLELDDQVPTYLTLSRLVGETAEDQSGTGRRIVEWVDRGGAFERDVTPSVVRYDEYVPETGHNLPDVTAELFNRPEFAEGRWVDSFGYPISEPYWTYYRQGEDLTPSMIQVFERRVLVYTPKAEPEDRFTVANTGRHYYAWRYGSSLTPIAEEDAASDESEGITTLDGFRAVTYAQDVGGPIDLTLSPTGHPLVLTQEGQILKPVSRDPDRVPEEFMVWADGIEGPLAIDTSGQAVVVTTVDGTEWYREQDGAGFREESIGYEGEPAGAATAGSAVDDPEGATRAGTGDQATAAPLDESGIEALEAEGLAASGPVQRAGSRLLVLGRDADGQVSLVAAPADAEDALADELMVLARFPSGSTPSALAVPTVEAWPISDAGRAFVAVADGDGASVFAVPPVQTEGDGEAIEFAGGFERPAAMTVGLDGALYIADTDLDAVVRIEPDA